MIDINDIVESFQTIMESDVFSESYTFSEGDTFLAMNMQVLLALRESIETEIDQCEEDDMHDAANELSELHDTVSELLNRFAYARGILQSLDSMN